MIAQKRLGHYQFGKLNIHLPPKTHRMFGMVKR